MAPRTEFTKYGMVQARLLPAITCWKCGRLVDRVEMRVDDVRAKTEFEVYCHGEKDTLVWPLEREREQGAPLVGKAFVPKRSETPAPIEPDPKPVGHVQPQPARKIIFD